MYSVRIQPSAMGTVEVSFLLGSVHIGGKPVALADKEMELLFTVAAAGTINGEQLMDIVWPESDGDAAHNAFRVCLHRLRKRMNAGDVIHRCGKAYALDGGVCVDLYRFHEAALDDLVAQIRAGHPSRARLGTWFDPFERLLWTYAQRCRKTRVSDLVTAS